MSVYRIKTSNITNLGASAIVICGEMKFAKLLCIRIKVLSKILQNKNNKFLKKIEAIVQKYCRTETKILFANKYLDNKEFSFDGRDIWAILNIDQDLPQPMLFS